ncbi:MAG TPA: polyphosphate kinase 1 [Holophagaceae bacterium]|nr:polyphosphate kinase 1 [Holophagaceae bacterium]
MKPRLPRPEELLNRELSWLDFNARVLEEAEDEGVPLLERVKFLSIASSNWDEFFMVRVAGIWREIDAGITRPGPDGLTPRQVLDRVSAKIHTATLRQHALFQEVLEPRLEAEGVRILEPAQLDGVQAAFVEEHWRTTLMPLVTPLAVDPGHPFPRLGNRALVLVCELESPDQGDEGLPVSELSFIPVPTSVAQRFLRLPSVEGRYDFVTLEDLVRHNLERIYSGYRVKASHAIRVTRDSDIPLDEDESEDLLKSIEESLRDRRRGAVVRLQHERGLSQELLQLLIRELDLAPEDLYPAEGMAAFSDLMQLYQQVDLPHLKDAPLPPLPVPQLEAPGSIFEAISRADILLSHPYQSFDDSVVRFIREAALDPKVLAIKMTLYRMSPGSPIASALEQAAERGKQVAAIVELRARFDEEANIAWARRLEKAGVHVVYGLPGYKTHCKATLVVRQEETGIRRYCHLGTGNYNERSSRLYADFGLLTAREEFGEDLSHFFNLLTGYTRPPKLHRLLPAPTHLKAALLDRIQREISHARLGRPARMILKANAIVDAAIIQALYEASEAGVAVDLIVRGTCCLKPGVPGLSANIRVLSILDRFLEHARIYHFQNAGEPETWLASADLMPRNLDRRVELAFPLVDPLLAAEVVDLLELQLQDTVKGRVIGPEGQTLRRGLEPGPALRSQLRFYERARQRSGVGDVTRRLT